MSTTTTTTDTFTKTEALRRLRVIAKAGRQAVLLPSNARAEVGHRTVPVSVPELTADTVAGRYLEDDDLRDFDDLGHAAGTVEVRTHGAFVHIYLSEPDGFGDWSLFSVVEGWMGTPDVEPKLVATDGTIHPDLRRELDKPAEEPEPIANIGQARAERLTNELAEATGLTLRLGYIGNLTGSTDDRLWSLWVYNARNSNDYGNLVQVGHRVRTANLDKLADELTIEELRRALGAEGVYAVEVYGITGRGTVTSTVQESAELIDAVVNPEPEADEVDGGPGLVAESIDHIERTYRGALVGKDFPDVVISDGGPLVIEELVRLADDHDGSISKAWGWLRDGLTEAEAIEWLTARPTHVDRVEEARELRELIVTPAQLRHALSAIEEVLDRGLDLDDDDNYGPGDIRARQDFLGRLTRIHVELVEVYNR